MSPRGIRPVQALVGQPLSVRPQLYKRRRQFAIMLEEIVVRFSGQLLV
ncbi:MAG: hypothetical protein ACOX1P_10420 [Thermoguttaceae bacterium]|jgi:hypothetical protein